MRTLAALFALVQLSLATTVDARIITLEPDDYASGANLSDLGQGAHLYTFSNLTGAPNRSAVYAQSNSDCTSSPLACDAFSGTMGFSSDPGALGTLYGDWFDILSASICWRRVNVGGAGASCNDLESFTALLIEFDRPTDYVELSGAYLSDAPMLFVFDAAFNVIGTCLQTSGGCTSTSVHRSGYEYGLRTLSLATDAPTISYVLAAGAGGNTSLDLLNYRVPEPATLGLFAVGLLGLMARRKTLPS